nr:hypothetical protein [Micromonospora sp. DSM 115978]
MELLGHSAIAVSMNTYSHVVPAATRNATDLMGDLLAGDDDPQDDDEAPDAA